MKKGEETKKNIIEQGLRLFSSQGYEETALKDIAVSVNIKTPSIYAYFESKQHLFEEIVSYVIEDYLHFIEQQTLIIEKFPTEQKLYYILQELNKYYYMNDKGFFLKRYGIYPPEKFKELISLKNKKVENEIKALIFSILKENKEENLIDSETVATCFMTILDGMLYNMMSYSYEEYESRLSITWSVFWRGIKK